MIAAIQYLNEHLFIGNLGHFLVSLAFVSALASGLIYLRKSDGSLRKWARLAFFIHILAVIGVFISLFIIIQQHYFEYAYAYQHSSLSLPLRYMVSCFWEGQEGSFLLWIVWNALIGLVLIFTAKKWESGVMPVIALAQVILLSMILGLELADIVNGLLGTDLSAFYKVGSTPFELLRDKMGDSAPIFSRPDYLNFITDGTGLNALLQNYWMVIHPPTLFLGFALTVVPFAFAITALFRGEHRAWIKPALPWALIGGMVLGAGIIMGGFWAYESLSFGGYWAWDPVENASLVPWLLLIAGIHLMLIKKVTNTATIASYILIIASYILVLYATFLTRSGVLGETSVHSFTDLGLAGQLMQLVVAFVWLPIIAVARNKKLQLGISVVLLVLIGFLPFYTRLTFYPILFLSLAGIVWFGLRINKELENKPSEDNIWSREFWMFIGALILVLSSLQVMVMTSLPVFNKILGTHAAPPIDAVAFYNRWQLPFAIIIGLLTATGQYFQYRDTKDHVKFWREILLLLGVSVILTGVELFVFGLRNLYFIVFLLSSTYALVANVWYMIRHLKVIKLSGGSITHMGFALMLIGVLVSSAKKRVITADFTGSLQNYNEDVRKENMLLWLDKPERLGDFMVTYQGDSADGPDIYFKVHYQKIDGGEAFTLYPNSQISDNEGLMSNPDTRHYITYDVYTHITSIPKEADSADWRAPYVRQVEPGDTIHTSNGVVKFLGMERAAENQKLKNATIVRAKLEIDMGGRTLEANPTYVLMDSTYFSLQEDNLEAGLRFDFTLRPTDGGAAAFLSIAETDPQPKYIVMKAIVFPFINLLWLGTILMVIGFGVAAYHRLELKRGT